MFDLEVTFQLFFAFVFIFGVFAAGKSKKHGIDVLELFEADDLQNFAKSGKRLIGRTGDNKSK